MNESETWLSDVIGALYNLGGEAHYSKIYREIEGIRKKRGATWPDSAEAITRRVLEEQSSDSLSFKGNDIFYSAAGLGKGVWGLRPVKHTFQIGELYNRQKDIHDRFGGSRQSGISPCKRTPYIFLFTGASGEQYGYALDGWDEEGVFNYTGEGQLGDMQFSDGNKAIRDHVKDGRDILLFQYREKGKSYRFIGQFICLGYETKEAPDREEKLRKAIVFKLKNVDEDSEGDEKIPKSSTSSQSILSLREKAYSSANTVTAVSSVQGKRTYLERKRDIRSYVLLRANGFCECCGKPAPFQTSDSTPYLESHHIYKLSDRGMDHPRMIAALTPNCHREIHFGKNGAQLDRKLEKIIADKEAEIAARYG